MKIILDDAVLSVTLDTSKVAQDFAALLPLPKTLSTADAPLGAASSR